ncbi:uncharacterized protein HD556DRAFT_1415964, partial [Suillus plorans]
YLLTANHWNLPVLILQTSHGLEGAPIPYMYIHALKVTVRRYHRDSQYSRSASQVSQTTTLLLNDLSYCIVV